MSNTLYEIHTYFTQVCYNCYNEKLECEFMKNSFIKRFDVYRFGLGLVGCGGSSTSSPVSGAEDVITSEEPVSGGVEVSISELPDNVQAAISISYVNIG